MAQRETADNNAYSLIQIFGVTKSIMVCYGIFWSGQLWSSLIRIIEVIPSEIELFILPIYLILQIWKG